MRFGSRRGAALGAGGRGRHTGQAEDRDVTGWRRPVLLTAQPSPGRSGQTRPRCAVAASAEDQLRCGSPCETRTALVARRPVRLRARPFCQEADGGSPTSCGVLALQPRGVVEAPLRSPLGQLPSCWGEARARSAGRPHSPRSLSPGDRGLPPASLPPPAPGSSCERRPTGTSPGTAFSRPRCRGRQDSVLGAGYHFIIRMCAFFYFYFLYIYFLLVFNLSTSRITPRARPVRCPLRARHPVCAFHLSIV